jgi:hypothetical protein
MRYERDFGSPRRPRAGGERGEYGPDYESRWHGSGGYSLGYLGGALQSRGAHGWGAVETGRRRGYGHEFQGGYGRDFQGGSGGAHRGRYGGGGPGYGPAFRGGYASEFGAEGSEADVFEWGEGYVGGRGYGGTNYDLNHGYRVTGGPPVPRGGPLRDEDAARGRSARGGYEWGEYERGGQVYGPARYGFGPYHDRLQRRRRPDDELRQDVEDALFYDTWVDADRIEVQVEDGVVTLRGTLPSYEEVRFATDDVWDVDGVRGVRSELRVEAPGRGSADARAAADARADERRGRSGAQAGRDEDSPPPTEAEAANGGRAAGKGSGGKGSGGKGSGGKGSGGKGSGGKGRGGAASSPEAGE